MNKKDFSIFKYNPGLIYLDSAATSQKPQAVIDSVVQFYKRYNAPIHRGMYPLAEAATRMYEDTRQEVAGFIGCDVCEIIFTKSATEGLNIITNSWAREYLRKNDEIILPVSEHHANFVPWQEVSEKTGARIRYVDFKNDSIDMDALLKAVTKKARVLAIALASNVTGELLSLSTIISKAKKKNSRIKIVVDAVQAVGRTSVNFKKLGADFLVFSGHKMYAPTGVGVLVIKKDLHSQMRPFITGGHMILSVAKEKTIFAAIPTFFEAGSPAAEAVIGLGAAIKYIQRIGIEKIRKHELDLVRYTLKKMQNIPGIHIIGTMDIKKRIGLISFYHEKIHAHDIASLLGSENIAVRAGHHCAMPLHKEIGVAASVRLSFGVFNNKKDIDRVVAVLRKILKIVA